MAELVMIDTSAWIEFFRDGNQEIVEAVDRCLLEELAVIGDLVYCEVIQGIAPSRKRDSVSKMLLSLPQYNLVGFDIAERAASNYSRLRSRGITVRKTIDMVIGTFCIEHNMPLIHFDRDFEPIAEHLGLIIWKRRGTN